MTQARVLAVDLDGTLLRSDMLFETFWSAFARDWRTPFRAARALLEGKAQLKRQLAKSSDVDVTHLPYDEQVVEYVRDWRTKGGHTVLVTATDQGLAEAVSDHLQIFDEVYGSDGENNLKGADKAAFLRDRFGKGSFTYVGDSPADLPVWKDADKAVTVNVSETLRHEVDTTTSEAEHLSTAKHQTRPYIKALRPHQWLKNILIFLPMLTAHQLTPETFFKSFLAFIAFSLVASSVYVMNDLLDLQPDRLHPRKRNRPFASGNVPLAHGPWMFGGMLLLGLLIGAVLGGQFLLVLVGYFCLTTAYSLDLKRRTVIDICVLAGLYTIRVIAGGAATGIELSIWLLAFSIFLFFSLAAVKRQAELTMNIQRGLSKVSGRGYNADDLMIISMMSIASGYMSVLVLALYLNSESVQQLYSEPTLLWGTCCVLLYWVSRTVMLAHRGYLDDDPVIYAVRDRISLACGALILCFALAGSLL